MMRIESAAADMISAQAPQLALHALGGLRADRDRYVEDATQHLRSLSDAILGQSEQLFVDYVEWAQTCLAARSAPASYLHDQLLSLRTALHDELPKAASAAESFWEAALQRLDGAHAALPSEVAPDTLAARFLERLLAYDRNGALALVMNALQEGTTLRDVYIDVVQRVQREIGRLWQLNRVSVAQEHYCTAVSQLVLAQLYPQMMHGTGGEPMVATCVSDELHELGARMVADFFEMDGWDTTYVGANAPAFDVTCLLRERGARLLAISATMGSHIHGAVQLISQVRDAPDLTDVKILVGGRPFLVAGELWKRIGADGCAKDAPDAVIVGRKLLGVRN